MAALKLINKTTSNNVIVYSSVGVYVIKPGDVCILNIPFKNSNFALTSEHENKFELNIIKILWWGVATSDDARNIICYDCIFNGTFIDDYAEIEIYENIYRENSSIKLDSFYAVPKDIYLENLHYVLKPCKTDPKKNMLQYK